MSERITSFPPKEACGATDTSSSEASRALEKLDFEIGRLPKGEIRGNLRLDLVALSRDIELLPETKAIVVYRTLRAQVTDARFEAAKIDLAAIKAELANQGGLIEWNRSPWTTRLNKWLAGYEASGLNTVAAFFDEASAIAEELDRQIEKASQPQRRYPTTSPKETGKTAKKRTSGALNRHLQNQAARAEANRGHVKGSSPGVDKGGKGKKNKKK